MSCDEGAEEVEEVGLHGEEVWGAGSLVLGVAFLLFEWGLVGCVCTGLGVGSYRRVFD